MSYTVPTLSRDYLNPPPARAAHSGGFANIPGALPKTGVLGVICGDKNTHIWSSVFYSSSMSKHVSLLRRQQLSSHKHASPNYSSRKILAICFLI